MIVFPTRLADATGHEGEIRAGATDLQERRRLGLAGGALVDLRDVTEARDIAAAGDGLRIGALATIAALADHAQVRAAYPALALAAGGLATPQIRAVATVAGNLLQRSRCWYFRAPESTCLKKGGAMCQARAGDHLYHACFDLGPCVAVHPSTLAMALLTYDAKVGIVGGAPRSIGELLGDGSDPRRENRLAPGEVIESVLLPAPAAGERGAYVRAIARARAEWPLVEVGARLGVHDGKIAWAAVAAGGVAPVPLRLGAVEAALVGRAAAIEGLADAAAAATDGAKPLPMTGYKLELLQGAVLEAIERALAGETKGGA